MSIFRNTIVVDNNVNFDSKVVEITRCDKKCCNIRTRKFNWIPDKVWKIIKPEQSKSDIKAGVFIVDRSVNKVLLVQSCGFLWGSPKGSLMENEDILEGAIREVKEETNICLVKSDLKKLKKIGHNAYYFYAEIKCDNNINIPFNSINDASGITWININCLFSLIDNKGNFLLNGHCKLLLYEYLEIKLPICFLKSKPIFPFIGKKDNNFHPHYRYKNFLCCVK